MNVDAAQRLGLLNDSAYAEFCANATRDKAGQPRAPARALLSHETEWTLSSKALLP
jgi:SOS response regulatory protein OraA/RecX